MAKKSSYEEQRAAELAYAEEYRRRLRRSKRSAVPDEAELHRIEEERRAAEAEREATVERGRREAEERRRRTEELIDRAKTVRDPMGMVDGEEWTPIAQNTDSRSEPVESSVEPTSYTVSVDGASVSHSLYIEGMSFGEKPADMSAAAPRVADSRRGRVYGRGVIYEEYEFDTPKGEMLAPTAECESNNVEFASADTSEGVRVSVMASSPGVSKGYRRIEPTPETVEYEGAEASEQGIDESHEEEREYSEFLKREREMSGGVSEKSDPRETYNGTYNAPEIEEDEPEAREEPPSGMDEEEAMLAFAGYYREADKRARESSKGVGAGYTPEFELDTGDECDFGIDEAEYRHEAVRREKEDKTDERELRREMERDMLEFVKSEERAKRTKKSPTRDTGSAETYRVEHPAFDKRAATRRKKLECGNDIALIEARIGSEISAIEAERDRLEFTFGDVAAGEKREDKKNEKRIKELKAKLANAKRLETADNERYYTIMLTDLAKVRLHKDCDVERVIDLREKLGELLARRDELNARLTELYLGRERGKKGGFEARAEEARRARRKEFKRRTALAGKIKREKVAYDYKIKLHTLMNEQVRLAGDIAECKHILRREKPKGEAAREVKKRLAELERDFRKNDKEIERVSAVAFKKAKNEKAKKTGEIAGWICLIILLIIAAVIVWQWEAISTFIEENIPNVGDLFPGDNPEEGGGNPDGGDENPPSDGTPDAGVAPDDGAAPEGGGTADTDATTDDGVATDDGTAPDGSGATDGGVADMALADNKAVYGGAL